MESFTLMKNSLIQETDEIANDSVIVKAPMTNTLKTTVIKKPIYISGDGIYKTSHVFDVPKQYDNLRMVFIKFYASTVALADPAEQSLLASRICKYIVLRTKGSRKIIQRLTSEQMFMRINELKNTPLYSQMSPGLDADKLWTTAGEVSMMVPLFWFFSEDVYNSLQTRYLEQLEIECIINDDAPTMGMSADFATLRLELIFKYFDTDLANKNNQFQYTEKPEIRKSLGASYDCFEEDTVTINSGDTSAKLLLRCPYPSFAIYIAMVDEDAYRRQVKAIQFEIDGNLLPLIDYRANYELGSHNPSFTNAGTFTYDFSKLKSRTRDSGLMLFTDEMAPTYLHVYFDDPAREFELKVFSEYRTVITADDKGFLTLQPTRNELPYTSSSLIPNFKSY